MAIIVKNVRWFLGSGSFPVESLCDLNGDGVVNLQDALVAIAQAIASLPNGTGPACTTSAYKGTCDAVSVERIISAAVPNSGVCK
jgi:hypothetical protein